MNSFFRRKPCTQLTISRKSAKMQCLREFFEVLIKFYQYSFAKVSVLKRLTNVEMSIAFRRAPCTELSTNKKPGERSNEQLLSWSALYLTFISKKSTKIQCLEILFKLLAKFIKRLSQGSCFQALCERSNEQLPSQGALYLTFYEQKNRQKCNAQEFCSKY